MFASTLLAPIFSFSFLYFISYPAWGVCEWLLFFLSANSMWAVSLCASVCLFSTQSLLPHLSHLCTTREELIGHQLKSQHLVWHVTPQACCCRHNATHTHAHIYTQQLIKIKSRRIWCTVRTLGINATVPCCGNTLKWFCCCTHMYTLHKKYINYEKTEITNNSNMLCFTT